MPQRGQVRQGPEEIVSWVLQVGHFQWPSKSNFTGIVRINSKITLGYRLNGKWQNRDSKVVILSFINLTKEKEWQRAVCRERGP